MGFMFPPPLRIRGTKAMAGTTRYTDAFPPPLERRGTASCLSVPCTSS